MLMSKVNITVSLPARSHFEKVRAMPGVRAVVPLNWFGWCLQGPERPGAGHRRPILRRMAKVYPGTRSDARRSSNAGRAIDRASSSARRSRQAYGWKVGQRIRSVRDLAQDRWR